MSEKESIRAFRSHPRSWERNLYVYPVLSRRARGLSVGVNLSPHKACNMDCVYCQVDRTVPAVVTQVDLDRVEAELDALLPQAVRGEIFELEPFRSAPEGLHRLADVAFSGDGEPTSYRGFLDACRRVVRAKERAGVPDLPVRVLTNAIDLDRDEVVEALALLDEHGGEVWAKLDAGTEERFARICRTRTPLSKVLLNITEAAKLRPVVIPALFLRADGVEPPEGEIEAWLARLSEIIEAGGMISLVQIYTVARPPAETWVSAVAAETLERIASLVGERLRVPAEAIRP